MKKKTVQYTKGEMGSFTVIPSFLPPPDQLVFREDNEKVTLQLSRKSLDLFRQAAKKLHVPYQRMIRNLVDQYAEQQLSPSKVQK